MDERKRLVLFWAIAISDTRELAERARSLADTLQEVVQTMRRLRQVPDDRSESRSCDRLTPDNEQIIGDRRCIHNARSYYLRCAINPCGPCEGCPDFKAG